MTITTNTPTTAQVIKQSLAVKDEYNGVKDPAALLGLIYPRVRICHSRPGLEGHSGWCDVDNTPIKTDEGSYSATLTVPHGKRQNWRYVATAGFGVIDAETRHRRLNVSPLILLYGYGYSKDGKYGYTCVDKQFFLFGRNEDGSHFLHRIRPMAAKSLETARRWMWALKDGEQVIARQGDVAFIRKNRLVGRDLGASVTLGNHKIAGDRVTRSPAGRIYVENPIAEHGEHRRVALQGVYEVRIAKAWTGATGNGRGD